ncbi:MAG: coth protein-domain-containing protein [Benjaminiella poitrasii]|nr:MAG: coth protein-domain-containing protein [Benjaminiella poitrasii]
MTRFILSDASAQKNVSKVAGTNKVKFNVIYAPDCNYINCNNSNRLGVHFEGNGSMVHFLNNENTVDPIIYTVDLAAVNKKRYKYVILDKEYRVIDSEPFFRQHTSKNHEKASLYEFYGRQSMTVQPSTLVNLYQQSVPSESVHYKEIKDRSHVHPSNEIPTFHIRTEHFEDFDRLRQHVLENIHIFANLTRITANHVETFDKVDLELSGQTSRLFKKLSFGLHIISKKENSNENLLNGYRRFKLRSCATDPSFLREKLYYDLLEASQAPTAKASFVRLFINGQPQGLYLLIDHYKDPFVQNVFGHAHQGALIQGSMQENPLAISKVLRHGANLGYLGPAAANYTDSITHLSPYKLQEKAQNKTDDELNNLISFIKFINSNKNSTDENTLIQKWNRRFDIPLFLKHMAFEIILGHSDGYLGAAHNYMLYQDPDQHNRFIWFASDLDQTMGSTLKATRPSTENQTAFEKLDRYGLFNPSSKDRPLVTEIFKVNSFKSQFYQALSDIYTAFFETNAIENHINYLRQLIENDVKWDQQLDQYRLDNFQQNRAVYNATLYEKVLQLPLGQDFIDRIENHSVDFQAAIEGPIVDHPSISSLFEWFRQVDLLLGQVIVDHII